MSESIIKFSRSSGNKKKDSEQLQVEEKYIKLQSKHEKAIIFIFTAPEDELNNFYKFFDSLDDLEPVLVDIADTGDVEHYFRGISPIKEVPESSLKQFTATLQLKRELI